MYFFQKSIGASWKLKRQLLFWEQGNSKNIQYSSTLTLASLLKPHWSLIRTCGSLVSDQCKGGHFGLPKNGSQFGYGFNIFNRVQHSNSAQCHTSFEIESTTCTWRPAGRCGLWPCAPTQAYHHPLLGRMHGIAVYDWREAPCRLTQNIPVGTICVVTPSICPMTHDR